MGPERSKNAMATLHGHLRAVVRIHLGWEVGGHYSYCLRRLRADTLACELDLALSSLACTVMLHWAQVGEWAPGATLHAMKSFLPLRCPAQVASAHGMAVPLSSPLDADLHPVVSARWWSEHNEPSFAKPLPPTSLISALSCDYSRQVTGTLRPAAWQAQVGGGVCKNMMP